MFSAGANIETLSSAILFLEGWPKEDELPDDFTLNAFDGTYRGSGLTLWQLYAEFPDYPRGTWWHNLRPMETFNVGETAISGWRDLEQSTMVFPATRPERFAPRKPGTEFPAPTFVSWSESKYPFLPMARGEFRVSWWQKDFVSTRVVKVGTRTTLFGRGTLDRERVVSFYPSSLRNYRDAYVAFWIQANNAQSYRLLAVLDEDGNDSFSEWTEFTWRYRGGERQAWLRLGWGPGNRLMVLAERNRRLALGLTGDALGDTLDWEMAVASAAPRLTALLEAI